MCNSKHRIYFINCSTMFKCQQLMEEVINVFFLSAPDKPVYTLNENDKKQNQMQNDI